MLHFEYEAVLSADWSPRFINTMVDALTKKVSSDLYITTTAPGDQRKVAMKSVVGVLSGNFKPRDKVKILIYGANQEAIDKDLKIIQDIMETDS